MSKIGNKNNNNTSVPTLAEYITAQIANKRAAALDKSRNRTSVRVPMIPNDFTEEQWKYMNDEAIKANEELLSMMMNEIGKSRNPYDRSRIERTQKRLDKLLEEKDAGYPKLVPGANCMYNAGDCYGLNISGNQTFATKHKEKGFKKATKGSMEPGDIVQAVDHGFPNHAMIYDSKDAEGNLLFNYARGNGYADLEKGYVKQGKYPLPIEDYDVYKYVGTPADSTQWINEYKQKYGNGMRCGGRRKAQLGLDIREGGIAIPIAPNMYYMNGRSHDDGGIAIGPNNKNGLEVEGGEVVKVGNKDIKVFSSVPLLRGVSPAQLVMGGANPNKVFAAQEEFKNRNRINDDGTRYEVGGEKNININNLPSSFRGRKIGNSYYQIGIPPSTNKIKSGVTGFKNYLKGLNDDLDEFGVTFTQVSKKVMLKPLRDTYAKIVNAIYKTNKIDKINTAANQIGTASMITDKKKYGGGMIYEINGNVRNGLSHRPKAKYGKIDKKDKDTKVGQDGLIYKRAADGEWYTDGTVHVTARPIVKNSRNDLVDINNGLMPTIIDRNGHYVRVKSIIPKDKKIITRKFDKPKRTYVGGYDEEEKETKKIGSLTYEKNESGKWVPSAKQSTTTTRDGGRPKDFGMTRTGVNHPNSNYKYHPLTGEKISEMGVVETSEPSVKGTTKVASKSSSTARGRGTKVSTPKAAAKTTTKGADVKYGTPLKEKKESLYMTGIKNNSITPLRAGMEKIKSPSSTGGRTQSKDGRWIGQYKTTNVGDWIGLGSNLAGSVASYFMTKNAINKMPDPVKPVMAQAAKLKTRYNIEPQLSNVTEAEQMNRASVRRNTQSSNTSLAREQRLLNEARSARNTLYGQKENIETQLINQDRLNRQSVMKDNVRAYNEYLNKVTATKMAQNEMRASNINNLISGLTGSVNSILGNIESRRATNNTLRAIAAANPNVDARLIGGFDYYIDPITKKKYNKNQQYVGTING